MQYSNFKVLSLTALLWLFFAGTPVLALKSGLPHRPPQKIFTDTQQQTFALGTAANIYIQTASRWQALLDSNDDALYCALYAGDGWLVGTEQGLYHAHAQTRKVTLVRHEPAGIRALARLDSIVYAASEDTLYRFDQDSWQQVGTLPGNKTIHDLIPDAPRKRLLVRTDQALWQWHSPSGHWQALTHNVITEQIGREATEASVEEDAEIGILPFLRDCIVSSNGRIYLATERGVQQSTAEGGWLPLPTGGLPARGITHLAMANERLLAGTARGVAAWSEKDNRWQRLPFLGHTAVLDLAWLDGQLLALTPEGLRTTRFPSTQQPLRADSVSSEPNIRDVQEAAIRYAEVEPEKIARWRKEARWKAFLPSLSIGYDRDTATYVTSRGSSSDSATDRIITAKDPSDGFDISLSWDLDELIWNNDQTSIDNRARLSALLREDVVDQVTRLYFERKRIQLSGNEQPPQEQKLYIDELTALIDGLTGGYFSNALTQQP